MVSYTLVALYVDDVKVASDVIVLNIALYDIDKSIIALAQAIWSSNTLTPFSVLAFNNVVWTIEIPLEGYQAAEGETYHFFPKYSNDDAAVIFPV